MNDTAALDVQSEASLRRETAS
eukprot:COSAG06_NODE_29545_length_554_cov_1.232967_1_plen_21_part_10